MNLIKNYTEIGGIAYSTYVNLSERKIVTVVNRVPEEFDTHLEALERIESNIPIESFVWDELIGIHFDNVVSLVNSKYK